MFCATEGYFLKTPSVVQPKMKTVLVFLEGLLHMQFTYPTAWQESWVKARGIQQWKKFTVFQLGEAGNGGINSKRGVTLHFLSSDSHRIKHLFAKNLPQSLNTSHRPRHLDINAHPNLSWVTDASAQIKLCFLKATVHCRVFLTILRTVRSIFPQSVTKKDWKSNAWHAAWVLWRQPAQGQRTCQNTVKTMTSTTGM